MPVEVKCLQCGSPFSVRPYKLRSGRGKFCGRACSTSYNHKGRPKPKSAANAVGARAAKAAKGNPPPNKKEPIRLVCGYCSKSFDVSHARADKAKYCSTSCHHAWKRTITGTLHPLYTRQERACEFCGKTVMVKPAKLHEFRFCSRTCGGSYMATIWPRTSSIELMVRQELKSRDVFFTTEQPIGPYAIDIALPQHLVAVECDGTYWHGTESQQKKDRRKDAYLRKHGWTVIRLPEADIRSMLSVCVDKIMQAIEQRRADVE